MTVQVYDFTTQLRLGEKGEAVIDSVLGRHGVLQTVTMDEQRQGIDRIMLLTGGRTLALEYKTDYRAGATGNIFIELKVGTGLGWLYKTRSDRVVWYLPHLGEVWVVKTARLFDNLEFWQDTLPVRYVQNPTYQASGIAVPLAHIKALASMVTPVERKTPTCGTSPQA